MLSLLAKEIDEYCRKARLECGEVRKQCEKKLAVCQRTPTTDIHQAVIPKIQETLQNISAYLASLQLIEDNVSLILNNGDLDKATRTKNLLDFFRPCNETGAILRKTKNTHPISGKKVCLFENIRETLKKRIAHLRGKEFSLNESFLQETFTPICQLYLRYPVPIITFSTVRGIIHLSSDKTNDEETKFSIDFQRSLHRILPGKHGPLDHLTETENFAQKYDSPTIFRVKLTAHEGQRLGVDRHLANALEFLLMQGSDCVWFRTNLIIKQFFIDHGIIPAETKIESPWDEKLQIDEDGFGVVFTLTQDFYNTNFMTPDKTTDEAREIAATPYFTIKLSIHIRRRGTLTETSTLSFMDVDIETRADIYVWQLGLKKEIQEKIKQEEALRTAVTEDTSVSYHPIIQTTHVYMQPIPTPKKEIPAERRRPKVKTPSPTDAGPAPQSPAKRVQRTGQQTPSTPGSQWTSSTEASAAGTPTGLTPSVRRLGVTAGSPNHPVSALLPSDSPISTRRSSQRQLDMNAGEAPQAHKSALYAQLCTIPGDAGIASNASTSPVRERKRKQPPPTYTYTAHADLAAGALPVPDTAAPATSTTSSKPSFS